MIYNTENPLERARADKRYKYLTDNNKLIELSEKTIANVSQKNYLHLIIRFLAFELGEQEDYVKDYYYKEMANSDIFVTLKNDIRTGQVNVKCLRSTSDLTKEEMTLSIDRFRTFSSDVCEVYLPSPNEEAYVKSLISELDRNRKFMY